jgi:hypothetical protein
MMSLVFRVITFAGSAAIFGFFTREYLRRRQEQEIEAAKGKKLPAVVDRGDTVDAEIIEE